MHKHIYRYIHCDMYKLQENINFIGESGYEIIHMSQAANGTWVIVYDVNPRSNL